MSRSILNEINDAVKSITWPTIKQQEKALKLCAAIFNLYTHNKKPFKEYLSLSSNYFTTILPSKRDYVIRDNLVTSGILETDKSYSVVKGIGKGYRFKSTVWGTVSNSTITSTLKSFQSITYLFPHSKNVENTDFPSSPPHLNEKSEWLPEFPSSPHLVSLICSFMGRLTIDDDVDELINQLTNIQTTDLTTNENISSEFVDVVIEKEERRFKRENATKFAKQNGLSLIQYKDNYYFETPDNFIKEKSLQLNICYKQQLFNLREKNFYCDRNETNDRLDYNLTGLKKELFKKIKFDGEELIELDIANAQFAIACHLNASLDANFSDLVKAGKLYSAIENELGLKSGEGKKLMFRIAFDKIKSDGNFDVIRTMFPKFMSWVDGIKSKYGYKMFSNLLQKKEAEIMIDGLFNHLHLNGYEVLPIHDSIRVKASQVKEIKKEIGEYFASIKFDCLVRDKETKQEATIVKMIDYNYNGFKIRFTDPTTDDKMKFLELSDMIHKEYGNYDLVHFEAVIRKIRDENKQYQYMYILDKFRKSKSR